MAAIPLYPLRFTPILRRLIWGGRRLGTVLGKSIGPEDDYAESWELADYKDEVSVVAEGPLAGTSLRELVHSRGGELLGPALSGVEQFPLLVKFIDASDVLSVQVHPDDEKGARLAGDNGKTETWIIVDSEPGSRIYAGLKPGVTREQFSRAIAAGTVEPLLHQLAPRAGDCVLIEAGTVHAIGAGVLLAEIQQMSDATFRVFDWNRKGADGQPRPLHVAQAIESTDFERGPVNPLEPHRETTAAGNVRERLSHCPYFAVERWRLSAPESIGSADRFTILIGLNGGTTVEFQERSYPIESGQTLLLPAAVGPCRVSPGSAGATILACVVP